MKTEPAPPTNAFKLFAARRIAEFPTLYVCPDDVIASNILGSQGDCYWFGGILKQPNYHQTKSKRWVKYPMRMPLKTAAEMHANKFPSFAFNTGSGNAPISKLPNDCDKSYLEAISHFLWKWGRITKEQWELVARVKCIMYYGMESNPNAGEPSRTIEDYERFLSFVPKWEAAIRQVEYFQQHGKIDARTFQAIDI